jgi:hypothetical protein
VELIKLVRERFGLSLAEAKSCVDRCVFHGETVALVAPTADAAAEFAREVGALKSPARFEVHVEADWIRAEPPVTPDCGGITRTLNLKSHLPPQQVN